MLAQMSIKYKVYSAKCTVQSSVRLDSSLTFSGTSFGADAAIENGYSRKEEKEVREADFCPFFSLAGLLFLL